MSTTRTGTRADTVEPEVRDAILRNRVEPAVIAAPPLRCAGCAWWRKLRPQVISEHADTPTVGDWIGECHWLSPVPGLAGRRARFPWTHEDDWCAQHATGAVRA